MSNYFGRPALLYLLVAALAGGEAAVAMPTVPPMPEGTARALVESIGLRGGLVVAIGIEAVPAAPGGAAQPIGDLMQALSTTGGWLSVLYDRDPARVAKLRRRFAAAGLTGLASAEWRGDLAVIPLRDELANGILVDLDAPGAPSRVEALRVLAPGGLLRARSKGSWSDTIKPRPAEYGTWTHDYKGPDHNAVADDRVAGLPLGMQWVGGYRSGNGLPNLIDESGCAQASNTFNVLLKDDFGDAGDRFAKEGALIVRDAFNGLPRLRVATDAGWVLRHVSSFSVINAGNRLFYVGAEGGPAISVDHRTGGDVVVYDRGLIHPPRPPHEHKGKKMPWPYRFQPDSSPNLQMVVHDGTLYQASATEGHAHGTDPMTPAGAGRVVALDVRTGALRWSYASPERWCGPVAAGHDGLVYAVEAKMPMQIVRFWGNRYAVSIVALDAATGAKRWSVPVPENGEIGQIIPQPGCLILVASGHHRWNTDKGYVAVLEAATGKTRWQKGFYSGFCGNFNIGTYTLAESKDLKKGDEPSMDPSGANGVALGGWFFMHGSYAMTRFSLADGNPAGIGLGGNQGCQRLYGRPDGSLMTFVSPNVVSGLTNPDMSQVAFTQSGVNHAFCAMGMELANGRTYNGANEMCNCNLHLRVQQCYASAAAAPPAEDAVRLVIPPADAVAAPGSATAPAVRGFIRADWETGSYSAPGTLAKFAAVPIRLDAAGDAPATVADGVTYVPMAHRHQLEARRDGAVLWRFQADGRLIAAPLVHAGRVYAPCRDGYLYCLDAASGTMRWKFLAAGADRRIVNSGQLESVWPVFGAVLHQGLVWTGAGLQLDLDDGIFLWGLDPASGAIRKRARLFNEPFRGVGVANTNPRNPQPKMGLPAPFAHIGGGGFSVHALAVRDGKLMVGYRRTGNYRAIPEPTGTWVYGVVDTETSKPQRIDRTTPEKLVVVPDDPKKSGADDPLVKRRKN